MTYLDLRPCERDRPVLRLVVCLEHDRRRTWPALGRTYREPCFVYRATLWTLDGLIEHLNLQRELRDDRHPRIEREAEEVAKNGEPCVALGSKAAQQP